MPREYKADDDLSIRSVAMSAIALAIAYCDTVVLKYRECKIIVNKDDSVNKVVEKWNEIKDTPQD